MTAQVATLLDKLREKEGEMEVKEAQLKEMKNMNAALENQLTEYMDALEHQNKVCQIITLTLYVYAIVCSILQIMLNTLLPLPPSFSLSPFSLHTSLLKECTAYCD